jgi:hypothetical protein
MSDVAREKQMRKWRDSQMKWRGGVMCPGSGQASDRKGKKGRCRVCGMSLSVYQSGRVYRHACTPDERRVRLLQTAPHLLAALRELARLGEQGMKPDHREWLTFHDKVAQVARAALAKAVTP